MKKQEAQKTNRTTQKRRRKAVGSAAQKQAQKKTVIPKGKNRYTRKELAQKGYKAKRYDVPRYENIGATDISSGRLAEYWDGTEMIPYFQQFRKGTLPKSYRYWDHQFLMDKYGLKGWEFGNWTTQEDRMNYVCAMGIALYDFQKVLGFKAKDMGLAHKVGIAIGARGKSRALAHFEPGSFMINLTRYKRKVPMGIMQIKVKIPKLYRFAQTGGAGSFAHEYWHALDYFFGGYVDQDPSNFALTDGRSLRTRSKPELLKKKSLRGLTEKLIDAIIWEKEGVHTTYYKKLKDRIDQGMSEYWIRRNELFARAGEQYTGYKLKQKGLENAFLHKRKYENIAYMDPALLKRIAPIFDQLMAKMRGHLKS